ncbi:hypothetical protein ACR6HW_11365 [Fusibacter sp. JL298sf-3]
MKLNTSAKWAGLTATAGAFILYGVIVLTTPVSFTLKALVLIGLLGAVFTVGCSALMNAMRYKS